MKLLHTDYMTTNLTARTHAPINVEGLPGSMAERKVMLYHALASDNTRVVVMPSIFDADTIRMSCEGLDVATEDLLTFNRQYPNGFVFVATEPEADLACMLELLAEAAKWERGNYVLLREAVDLGLADTVFAALGRVYGTGYTDSRGASFFAVTDKLELPFVHTDSCHIYIDLAAMVTSLNLEIPELNQLLVDFPGLTFLHPIQAQAFGFRGKRNSKPFNRLAPAFYLMAPPFSRRRFEQAGVPLMPAAVISAVEGHCPVYLVDEFFVAKPNAQGVQCTTPCAACPWRKTGAQPLPNSLTVADWLVIAETGANVNCTEDSFKQCAGLALFRASEQIKPAAETFVLPPNNEVVATTEEFIANHAQNRQTSKRSKWNSSQF